MARQTEQAIAEADVVVFVVDGRVGLTALDKEIANKLRRTQRSVLVAVNKAEGLDRGVVSADFHELGLGDPYTISAAHGEGVRDLLELALEPYPEPDPDEEKDEVPRVAIVGRPNVGKSTLINALIGEERVIAFDMQNAQPPEQVQAAFDDAVKAGQDRERQKNEGQAYANDVIPKARGTAARLTQEAQGYRQRIIATAEGDAARFKQILPEYAKAPQVTRERMYLETMQQVLSNTSKVMVDAKGQGKLLYLPLDKLMQAAGAPNANNGANAAPGTEANARSTTSPAGGNGAAPVGRSDDQHSREGLRSRDRDGR